VAEERRGENQCDSPGDTNDIWRSMDVDTTILCNTGMPYKDMRLILPLKLAKYSFL
jgi:hypothetical protein